MTWYFSPFFFLYLFSATISLYMAFYVWKRRFMSGAKPLALTSLCVAFWIFLSAFEISIQDPAWKTTFSKFQYLGTVFIAPLWLLFVIEFTENKNKLLNAIKKAAIWIIPVFGIILVFTNELHKLVWPSISLITSSNGILQIYDHGFGFYLIAGYSYLLLIIGTLILFKFLFTSEKYQKQQVFFLLIGAVIPWIANFLYILKFNPFPGIELTPISFAFSEALLALSIFRYQLFELIPLAKQLFFSNIDIGYIILDKFDLVIETNTASKKLFNINFSMGADIKNYFTSNTSEIIPLLESSDFKKEILLTNQFPNRWIEISVIQIKNTNDNSIKGKLIISKDITEQKQFEKKLQEANSNTSAIIENTSDFIVYIDTEKKYIMFNSAFKDLAKKAFNTDVKVGMSSVDFLPPEDKIWWDENDNKALKGERFSVELCKKVNGKEIYHDISFNPVFVNNQLIGVSIFSRDISNSKLIEKELHEKVAELERINNVMIGRELKMIELKKEIEEKETTASS